MLMSTAGNEPDIILLTETLPKVHNVSISLALLSILNYQAYFNFDPNLTVTSKIRGVGISVHSKISGSTIITFCSEFKEALWVEIPLHNRDSLLIGCIYRSPSSNLANSVSLLCNLLNMIDGYTHLLICGDFNFPNIDWSFITGNNNHTQAFVETIQYIFSYQHVDQPTRYRPNTTPHILNLILTNGQNMVSDLEYLPGLGSSDHVCLRFNLACYSTCSKVQLDLRSANFTKMCELLEAIDWHTCIDPLNTLQAWDFFAKHFESCLKECVPYKRPSNKKQNILMTQQALHLRNTKKKLWQKIYLYQTEL